MLKSLKHRDNTLVSEVVVYEENKKTCLSLYNENPGVKKANWNIIVHLMQKVWHFFKTVLYIICQYYFNYIKILKI